MGIELKPETEELVRQILDRGKFADADDLVETALRHFARGGYSTKHASPAATPPASRPDFRQLRRRIEEAGIPLLDEDAFRDEVAQRRGRRF